MHTPKFIHPFSLQLPKFAKSLSFLPGIIGKKMGYLICPEWHSSVTEQDSALTKVSGPLSCLGLGHGQAALMSLRSLFKMQNVRLHLRPTESKPPFSTSLCFVCTLKSEDSNGVQPPAFTASSPLLHASDTGSSPLVH